MILTEFINSAYFGSKEEYSDLVDFHTYTGNDVYVYDDYTVSNFDTDEWNARINYFFSYYKEEILKISNDLGKELYPVIIHNDGLLETFKDIDSFKEYVISNIDSTLFNWDGRSDMDVKIALNTDSTISIIHYYNNEYEYRNINSTTEDDSYNKLGYITKSTFDYLWSIPKEEREDSYLAKGVFDLDLDLYEDVTVNKFYFNSDNNYYNIKASIDIKNKEFLSKEKKSIKEDKELNIAKENTDLKASFYNEDVNFASIIDDEIPF